MTHAYHDVLPGFHADQILHDGCGECEQRSAHHDHGISSLDIHNFARACHRAQEWGQNGLSTVSDAELPMLSTLWSVWLQFERRGLTDVLGGLHSAAVKW